MSQASKQLLIDLINEFIKANGNREITGDVMNYTLKQIVSEAEISEVALNSKIDTLSSSVIVFPKDASVTEAHINRVIVNDCVYSNLHLIGCRSIFEKYCDCPNNPVNIVYE